MIIPAAVYFDGHGYKRKSGQAGRRTHEFNLAAIPEVVAHVQWFSHDRGHMGEEDWIFQWMAACGMLLRDAAEYRHSGLKFEAERAIHAVHRQWAQNKVWYPCGAFLGHRYIQEIAVVCRATEVRASIEMTSLEFPEPPMCHACVMDSVKEQMLSRRNLFRGAFAASVAAAVPAAAQAQAPTPPAVISRTAVQEHELRKCVR